MKYKKDKLGKSTSNWIVRLFWKLLKFSACVLAAIVTYAVAISFYVIKPGWADGRNMKGNIVFILAVTVLMVVIVSQWAIIVKQRAVIGHLKARYDRYWNRVQLTYDKQNKKIQALRKERLERKSKRIKVKEG